VRMVADGGSHITRLMEKTVFDVLAEVLRAVWFFIKNH